MLVHLVVVVPACKGFLAPSQKCYYNCKKVRWRVLYKVSSWNFRVSGLSFQLENPLEFDFRFRKSSKPNLVFHDGYLANQQLGNQQLGKM